MSTPNRKLALHLLPAALAVCSSSEAISASTCNSADPAFICGVENAEDIVRLG
jgi:hypothetical protein